MSDPNAFEWQEQRTFFAFSGGFWLTVRAPSSMVRFLDEPFSWEVGRAGLSGRSGSATTLLKAKRAAEACAREWKSEIELAGGVP